MQDQSISNPLQRLLMIYQQLYSYQNNQSYLVSKKHVLIEEIDPPSSSKGEVVDAISIRVDTCIVSDSSTVTSPTERDDVALHVCSLSRAFTENTQCNYHQAVVENGNPTVTIDFCGSKTSPIGKRVLPSSQLQKWKLHLIQLSEQLAYSPLTLIEYLSMYMTQVPQALTALNTYALKEVSLIWPVSTHTFLFYNLKPASKRKRRFHYKPASKGNKRFCRKKSCTLLSAMILVW